MDKQKEKELAVFRLMGERCAEKMHRSNSVLLNALRRKPAAASILQQAETVFAMDKSCFNSGTRCNSTPITQFESGEINASQHIAGSCKNARR